MKKIHGMSGTRFYGIWNDMMMRCYNPNKERYNRYGGRGITVCKRWHTFNNFYVDMFPTYKEGLSIERVRVKGNYCKSNCEWIPIKDQSLNRENTISLTIDGKKGTVAYWSSVSGTNEYTVYNRVKLGWTDRECVFGNGERKKCSPEEKETMKNMFNEGVSLRQIGRIFSTSHSAIKSQIQ